MTFAFDESLYAVPGSAGDFDAVHQTQVDALRALYPELGAWGDLAIEHAWRSYSDAVLMTGWSEAIGRTDDFLNFVVWEQTRGSWPWGAGSDGLEAVASLWKKSV